MIKKLSESSGKIIGFTLSEKLHDDDYKQFVPEVEAVIEKEGKARLMVIFKDFHGWDAHALWDDIKFAAKHYSDVERIALVGDKKWEKWMAKVCMPFTKAKIKDFDIAEIQSAWAWIREPTSLK